MAYGSACRLNVLEGLGDVGKDGVLVVDVCVEGAHHVFGFVILNDWHRVPLVCVETFLQRFNVVVRSSTASLATAETALRRNLPNRQHS